MAAKKKRQIKATPPSQPPARPQQCQKCGCAELITQLRNVGVDIGWKATQIGAIAPCQMCTKCGNTTVTLNANIGDLADLIPDPDSARVKFAQAKIQDAKEQAAAPANPSKKKAVKKKAVKKSKRG